MGETMNYSVPSPKPGGMDMLQSHDSLVPAKERHKLGIALAGLGSYSSHQLASAFHESKFCRLAGLITGSTAKIPEWKTRYSIRDEHIYNYDNLDKIADDKDIDIIYITVPNTLHAEYTIRAAKAGKHIICEKPMAITVNECDEMISACRKAGKLLSVAYRLHHDPYHQELVKIGREKIFGEINYLHAKHGVSNMGGWRLNKKLAGGGALLDLGIYCIHSVQQITGQEVVAVNAKEWKLSGSGEANQVEEFLSWEMELSGGLITQNETSYIKDMNLLHGKAEHGWFELSPAYSYSGITGKTATGFLNFPPVNQQALQMDDFALSVFGHQPVKSPGELGRKDVQIIQAIYQSMKTRGRVEI